MRPVLLCWFWLLSRLRLHSRLFMALQPSIYGFTAVYLRLHSRLFTASQPSIYGFTAVYLRLYGRYL